MLILQDLCVQRGGRTVISGLNLALEAGTTHALVGSNGAGKTSTLLAALGLLPAIGTISKKFIPAQLGVIWQDRALPLNISVDRWFKYLESIFEKQVDFSLFDRFNIEYSERPIRTLSGGEQQKIAIISAFFHNPKMIVMDEPTVGLDEYSKMQFLEVCKERNAQGSAILLTSHNSSDLVSLTSQITNLGSAISSNTFLFTTSRLLLESEIIQIQSDLDLKSFNISKTGFIVSSDTDIFSKLALFAHSHNFAIKSFTELS